MSRVLLMFATVLMFCMPASAQTEEAKLRAALKSGEIIRLHVIAAGDDDENQRIKLCVRDKVLLAFRDALEKQGSAEDMMAFLEDNLGAMEKAAQEAAGEEGFQGKVTAQTGVFSFPDRWYGSVLVPKGEYKALRIVLGEGKGKNWWCVLFPSLCLSLASSDAPPQDAGAKQEQGRDEVYFSWFLQDVFFQWPVFAPV